MRKRQEKILDEITRRLLEEVHPRQVFLFGSHAWGKPDEDSDIDLMLVVSESGESIRATKQRARRCLRGIMIPLDLVVETAETFERRRHVYASLESMVADQGIKLHG